MLKNKSDEKIFSTKSLSSNDRNNFNEKVNASLNNIYKDEFGQEMNINRLEMAGGRGKLYYLNIILAVGILVAGGLFAWKYISSKWFNNPLADVEIFWESLGAVTSGEEVELSIVYNNPLDTAIKNVEIISRVPDNFVISENIPVSSDEDKRLWKINEIAAGTKGKISIKGKLFGEIGTSYIFQASMSYEPINFSSRFEKQASVLLQIGASTIITKKEFPAQAVVGEKLNYKVLFFAVDGDDLHANSVIRVVPTFPEAFEVDKESIHFVSGESYWEVSGLFNESEAPTDTNKIPQISFAGNFNSDTNPAEKIILEYFVKGADENFYLEKKDELTTQLVQGEFVLGLVLNGENSVKAINLGEALNYTISYRNQSASSAEKVEISLTFPSGFMDYDTLVSQPLGKREGDKIIWTSEEIEDLRELASGEGGKIDISVTLKDKLSSAAAAKFNSQAEVLISSFSGVGTNLKVRSNEIESAINSDLEWYNFARYYNDDDIAIGTGPMPPQVGKPTTLHIIWRLTSSSHTIKAIKVRGALPAKVEWTGKTNVDNGKLSYDSSSRTVTWQFDTLEKDKGVVTADFEVKITPTFEDLNTIMLLISQATLTALDQDTAGEINISGRPLTTDLTDDPILSGKGLVEN